MHVSARSDYALRALLTIAGRSEESPISAEAVGAAEQIPHPFLQAILADLRRAGIVHSQRGPGGGWRLAREPGTISVADVLRAVDGPLVSIQGVRPEAIEYSPAAASLQLVWIAVRGSLREVLESITLAELVNGRLPASLARHVEDDDAWTPR